MMKSSFIILRSQHKFSNLLSVLGSTLCLTLFKVCINKISFFHLVYEKGEISIIFNDYSDI